MHAAYLRPARLEEALEALAARPLIVLAGGTDHYPARVGRDPEEDILDLTALAPLKGISRTDTGWRIGATTSWTEVIESRLPALFDVLKLAAREVGGVQVQNAGTVAGNLCNASPAADGVPALMALDASVELASQRGGFRTVALEDFILGPRKTARASDEIVTAVLVPKPAHEARGHFLKLGARKYLVISIAMVAIVLEAQGGTVRKARIAVGACSPVARRLKGLESELTGRKLDNALPDCVTPQHLELLQPIDDVRASAEYRAHAALTLVRRGLETLARQA